MRAPSDTVVTTATWFGVRLSIHSPIRDAAKVAALLPVDSNCTDVTESEHRFTLQLEAGDLYRVRSGRSWKAPPQPLAVALRILQKEVYLYVAEKTTSYVFIHAGVVQLDGITVVFPGFSHAGKSTLVWSLVQHGAQYYSDEYAVFDEQGAVHPFALPINLRVNTGERHSVMPLCVGATPLQPQIIVFASYRPSAVWKPRTLCPAETTMQLVRHSIGIRVTPRLVLPVLTAVSLQTRAFLGVRNNTEDILHWLQDTVSSTLV